MAVSAKISLKFEGAITRASLLGAAPGWPGAIELIQSFADGITANKADLLYMNERTVTTGANDDIDLAGVLTDAFGATITAAEMVAIGLINKQLDGTANTTNLTIGGGSNPFIGFLGGTAPTIGPIGPGGWLWLGCPSASGIGAVTAGTGDILRIANSAGATNKYLLALLARTA